MFTMSLPYPLFGVKITPKGEKMYSNSFFITKLESMKKKSNNRKRDAMKEVRKNHKVFDKAQSAGMEMIT